MEDLAVKLQEVKDRSLRNEGRIKQLEVDRRALNELALSVKELATDQTNMKEDIGEIKANVQSLTAVPSKRWEKVVELMIATVVGAFMAWLLTGGAV